MNSPMLLLVVSGISLMVAPVILMMSAFSINGAMIAGVLLIMGALGLYAGMRATGRSPD